MYNEYRNIDSFIKFDIKFASNVKLRHFYLLFTYLLNIKWKNMSEKGINVRLGDKPN